MDRLLEISQETYANLIANLSQKDVAINIIKEAILKYHHEQSLSKNTSQEDFKDGYKRKLFEVFWLKYDKKVGKSPSIKKWMRLKKEEIELILNTVEDFVLTHPDIQFRANPLTYLNQRRWEDELPSKQTPLDLGVTIRKNTWQY
jgi:hypothetical protein